MKRHVLIRTLSKSSLGWRHRSSTGADVGLRRIHAQVRQHRDNIWIPTVNINSKDGGSGATDLLIRAGFLRQAYAGIFHMLPLGLRVQDKLERLIDKHMRSIGASKVSLSSISSQTLWERSGRLKTGSELFTLQDRKETKLLLSPTHEEEITVLVADLVHQPQDLPIRLYQIGRKYRDEKRPRGGLLRGREFLMKDLYTFDATPEAAHTTYDETRAAYRNFFNELKVPYVEARATSGDMGGDLSHEYHFLDSSGEDTVINCPQCDYARNEEFVNPLSTKVQMVDLADITVSDKHDLGSLIMHDEVSKNSRTLVRALARSKDLENDIAKRMFNTYEIKAAIDGIIELDTGIEDPTAVFHRAIENSLAINGSNNCAVYYLMGRKLELTDVYAQIQEDKDWLVENRIDAYIVSSADGAPNPLDLTKQRPGDWCPQCETGKLRVDKAVEVGHTFHLGTRYSSKLGPTLPNTSQAQGASTRIPVEMGCHGIGVSRLIAAVASCLSDKQGLNWPRVIAPYEVLIVGKLDHERLAAAELLYDQLTLSPDDAVDVLLDDRRQKSLGWKLNDADMIGYPVVVVVGKSFEQGKVEIQCRRLQVKEEIDFELVPAFVRELLSRL